MLRLSRPRPSRSRRFAAALLAAAGLAAVPAVSTAQGPAFAPPAYAPPASVPSAAVTPLTGDPADRAYLNQEGYVALGAPLYPSPRQDIPIQVGGTMITNPAFAPHEYLYAHDYKALYGPFYHRARGTWTITPWGVRTREKWDLVGTEVKVKYRSKIPFSAGFSNPFHSRHTLFDNEWGNTPSPFGSPLTENLLQGR